MSIVIRKASDNDIQSILELLYELDRPKPVNHNEITQFKIKINEYLSEPDKKIFVAETNSKMVGLVSIMILSRLNHVKHEMYIPELIVTKKMQRTGIGKRLIEYCMELAKKENCYRIRLESGNVRKNSHIFYKNMGFVQYAQTFAINIS